MGVYDSFIALAERLIREKGKPITVIFQDTIQNIRPWQTDGVAQLEVGSRGVFLNFNQEDRETWNAQPGAPEVDQSDRKVLIAPASHSELRLNSPKRKDIIRDETGDWAIEYVQVIAPNGENILYTLRVRR